MPATPLDSAIYRGLLGHADLARLFTDSAEIRAMLLVEGALARVQGAAGLIPETSAAAIHRASLEIQIDPAGLAQTTGANAVPVPALVAAFREAMGAPEHAAYIHWGATSQDIVDTALALRLRQALAILETDLKTALRGLGTLARTHADLPMAGRTYGQAAVPTSFGAVVAAWGAPLLALRGRLDAVRDEVLCVSLAGAAGTLSVLGEAGPDIRTALARELDLADPGGARHSTRHGVAGLAGWLAQVAASLGKMGEDLVLLTQTGIEEVALAARGGSSTMPQKANPVVPSLLAAIARTVVGLNAVMQGAAIHRQQRDGAAWIAEWLSLPQMVLLTGRAAAAAAEIAGGLAPRPERMAGHLQAGAGTIHAETLSFALARTMPRPDAQAATRALAARAVETGRPLRDLALAAHPDLDTALFDPRRALGQAPAEARAFAEATDALD